MTPAFAVLGGLAGLAVGATLPVVAERAPATPRLPPPVPTSPLPTSPIPTPPIPTPPHPAGGVGVGTPVGAAIAVGTGVLFGLTALRFGAAWELPAFLLLVAVLIVLSMIDVRRALLPNRVVYPAIGGSIVLLAAASAAAAEVEPLLRALACGAGTFVVFTVLHAISPGAMGFGDVKLSFLLGLDLGWLGVPEAVLGVVLGFVSGALGGVVLLATRARGRKDHIPFGPFLAAGTVMAMLVGDVIIEWYGR